MTIPPAIVSEPVKVWVLMPPSVIRPEPTLYRAFEPVIVPRSWSVLGNCVLEILPVFRNTGPPEPEPMSIGPAKPNHPPSIDPKAPLTMLRIDEPPNNSDPVTTVPKTLPEVSKVSVVFAGRT